MAWSANDALVLDVDGTLLDIAATPDAVRVPRGLVAVLNEIHAQLGGGLALLSGRASAQVQALFAGLRAPVLGSYGCESPFWSDEGADAGKPDLRGAVRAAESLMAKWPGTLWELKPGGMAFHWRGNPSAGPALRAHAQALSRTLDAAGAYVMLGHCVAEVVWSSWNKGKAVHALWHVPPFAARRSVVAGDDLADVAAMRAARALGGRAVHIGAAVREADLDRRAGDGFFDTPAALRAWLARTVDREVEA